MQTTTAYLSPPPIYYCRTVHFRVAAKFSKPAEPSKGKQCRCVIIESGDNVIYYLRQDYIDNTTTNAAVRKEDLLVTIMRKKYSISVPKYFMIDFFFI